MRVQLPRLHYNFIVTGQPLPEKNVLLVVTVTLFFSPSFLMGFHNIEFGQLCALTHPPGQWHSHDWVTRLLRKHISQIVHVWQPNSHCDPEMYFSIITMESANTNEKVYCCSLSPTTFAYEKAKWPHFFVGLGWSRYIVFFSCRASSSPFLAT